MPFSRAESSPSLHPFEWAYALRTPAADDASMRRELAALLAAEGYLRAPAVLLGTTPLPAPGHAADDALCVHLSAPRALAMPSVNLTPEERPRFFVTATNASDLLADSRTEFTENGVHAEVRLFLDEALQAGDAVIDAAPGLGYVALTAATAAPAVPVLTMHQHAGDAHALTQSATLTGVSITAVVGDTVDTLPSPSLADAGYVVLHAGYAADVPAVLRGARQMLQQQRIGVVAFRTGSADELRMALTVLDVLGFAPLTLADGEQGMELVPLAARPDAAVCFALSEGYIARAPRASGMLPVAASTEPLVDAAPGYTPSAIVAHHARTLFDAVGEDVAPGAGSLGGAPTKAQLTTARLELHWRTAQVVSFDIFDTLLLRRVATPVDVFLLLSSRGPFASHGFDAHTLATLRHEAESAARIRGYSATGSGEVQLAEVHTVLAERLGWPSARVSEMVACEQAIELELCVAHPTLAPWFARAKADGKTLWCISDTYHDAAFLRRLLTASGYDMEHVLVVSSADARCSKGEGALIPRVLAEQQVAPDVVLHIGDNDQSDYTLPLSHGVMAVLHPWSAARVGDRDAQTETDTRLLGVAQIGVRCSEPPAPFWWRFGYGVAGPLLVGFATWLHERFTREGIEHAYFLLRDGEILEQVYRLVANGRVGPSTSLLESSRRAFSMPAYEAQRATLLAQLTVSENPRPVREFLERMGVSAAPFAAAARSVGFSSLDEIVLPDDRASLRRVRQLLREPGVAKAFADRSRTERALMLGYLEQEQVFRGAPVAFVDVGWNATIQRSLMAALQLEGRSLPLHGYYLGTLRGAHVGLEGSTVQGYLFEDGQPVDRARTVMQLPQLLEFVCSTARGSLKGFTRQGGRVVPVHGDIDHDAQQQVHHAAMRTGVLEFAREAASSLTAGQVVSAEVALRRLARVIEQPTAEEASHVGNIRHGDGLGADRSRTLAAYTPGAWSVDAIHKDRLAAYWPTGLAARREPQALVLRTLQWLAEDVHE